MRNKWLSHLSKSNMTKVLILSTFSDDSQNLTLIVSKRVELEKF